MVPRIDHHTAARGVGRTAARRVGRKAGHGAAAQVGRGDSHIAVPAPTADTRRPR